MTSANRGKRRNEFHSPGQMWVVAMCLGVAFCNSIAPFAHDIQRRTVPTGGSTTVISQSHPTAASIRYEWDIRTDLTWEQYVEWVGVQLMSDFGPQHREPTKAVFTRGMNGDVYRLSFEPIVAGREHQVHVTLDAAAD